jgi:hypothetical protein
VLLGVKHDEHVVGHLGGPDLVLIGVCRDCVRW